MQTRSNLRTSVICSLLRLQQETHCFSLSLIQKVALGSFDRLPSDEQHPILKQVDQSSNLIRHLSKPVEQFCHAAVAPTPALPAFHMESLKCPQFLTNVPTFVFANLLQLIPVEL